MGGLPDKIVRLDVLRVEYGMRKMCQCRDPHHEVDYQNKLVHCVDCGAIVDPLEALVKIARDTERWSEYVERLRDQRAQIENYHPRLVVLKELEKKYNSADRRHLVPTCPHCGEPFRLESLLSTNWCSENFLKEGK